MKNNSKAMKSIKFLAFMGTMALASTSFAYSPQSLVNRVITCRIVNPGPYERPHSVVYSFLGNFKGMDLVKISSDFGYGPEGGEMSTYKVSRTGLLSIQYNMNSDITLIGEEKTLDLNEFQKNNGLVQRQKESRESNLDEDGSTSYQKSLIVQTCTLK